MYIYAHMFVATQTINERQITAPARKLVMLVAVSFDGVVIVMFVRLVDRRRCRCHVRGLG